MRACQSAVRGFAAIRLMMIHCSISSGSCGYRCPHRATLPEPCTGIEIVSARSLSSPIASSRSFPSQPRTLFFLFLFFFSSSSLVRNDPSRTNQRRAPPLPPPSPLHFYSPRSVDKFILEILGTCIYASTKDSGIWNKSEGRIDFSHRFLILIFRDIGF